MNTQELYRDCKTLGLSAVAVRLGTTPERLVDALHRAGVNEERPTRVEIRKRCQELQRARRDGTRICRDK